MSEDEFPYVALSIQSTGIHPSTGRLLTLDAVVFDDAGDCGDEFHAIFSSNANPGPRHLHGLSLSDFAQAPKFARHLKALDRLIDKRTLVLHDTAYTWGFIVSEARRAMNAAARANRSRAKRNTKRRQRVGHVPRPVTIVDTLATARRQGEIPLDLRPSAVARLLGVDAPDPVASVERATCPEADTSREQTLLVKDMFDVLRERGPLAQTAPEDLVPDRFGLQRSPLRVDAENDDPAEDNPGPYTTRGGLKPGMEIVVSDDIAVDPDEIIGAAMDKGLTYAEKLSRQTSLVVSDAVVRGVQLRGKAMHAHRKDIPILSAPQFETAVAQLS